MHRRHSLWTTKRGGEGVHRPWREKCTAMLLDVKVEPLFVFDDEGRSSNFLLLPAVSLWFPQGCEFELCDIVIMMWLELYRLFCQLIIKFQFVICDVFTSQYLLYCTLYSFSVASLSFLLISESYWTNWDNRNDIQMSQVTFFFSFATLSCAIMHAPTTSKLN